MSALGDYVHLYYKNYQKYGTTKDSPKNNETLNFSAIMQNRLNSIREISSTALALLASRLAANSYNSVEREKMAWTTKQQELIDEVWALLYERVQTIGDLNSVLKLSSGGHQFRTGKKGETVSFVSLSSFAPSSQTVLKDRRKKASQKRNEIQTLIENINKNQPASEEQINRLVHLFEEYSHLSVGAESESVIGSIEKRMGQLKYASAFRSIQGQLGEMLVAICDDRANELGAEAVASLIQQTVKGDERTKISFDKDLIVGKPQFLSYKDDSHEYYIGQSQNKVDVQIKVKDEDVFASVKKYQVRLGNQPRSHLQDVNLFSTITFLNQFNDFGNHWLNLRAAKGSPSDAASELDTIVKQEVAFQALASGNPLKKGTSFANVFIFIDSISGNIYVKSVKRLLQNLNAFSGLQKIDTVLLKNQWEQSGPEERITSILQQLHKCFLSISISLSSS